MEVSEIKLCTNIYIYEYNKIFIYCFLTQVQSRFCSKINIKMVNIYLACDFNPILYFYIFLIDYCNALQTLKMKLLLLYMRHGFQPKISDKRRKHFNKEI